jgi:hypothetical protein
MKKWLRRLLVFLAIWLIPHVTVDAHILDETKLKSAQSQYSDYYQPIQQYKGQSGVTFISYSPSWNSVKQLQELEAELLKNKHGNELSLLEKVEIYPDYPAGKHILGQYRLEYEYSSTDVKLLPGRTIDLYGGNDYKTVKSLANTLAHEYGHHFTMYHILDGENKRPEQWMDSSYASVRGLKNTPAHDDGTGEYEWLIHEIAAEDYVQLFGSEEAIKDHFQMNVHIPTPFDIPDLQSYWKNKLHSNEYVEKKPIPFYLTDYQKNRFDPAYVDLKFYAADLQYRKTYIIGQEGSGTYRAVQLDEILPSDSFEKWYRADEMPPNKGWIMDSSENQEALFHLIQHEEKGFNRGSKTLNIVFNQIENNKTDQRQINLENQLSTAEIKQYLHEMALKYGIPAEILKAIAYVETGMKQFDQEGNPIVTEDGGIGIMQITLTDDELRARNIDKERLMYDTKYNIEIGAQILKEKWNWAGTRIPKINDHQSNMIEHWYFAVMAYNGLSKRNDPNLPHEKKPYQERVFEIIRNHSFVKVKNIPPFEVEYSDPSRPDVMYFPKKQYQWPELNTRTTQNYKVSDKVYTWNTQAEYSNVRNDVDGSIIHQVDHYTPFEIIGGPFESAANSYNHYVFYKVKANGIEGYVASSNLVKADVKIFSDINRNEVASAVTYLYLKGVISGYPDGTFRPNEKLLRRHAAKMLVAELGLTLPEGYVPKAKDMKPGDLGYEDMVIAEAHGLMGQGGALRPNEYLTRAQMASILARAYNRYYEEPKTKKTFKDVPQDFWNYDDINTLFYNGITVADPFRPNEHVTRSQFALFLKRTLELKEQ